MRQPKSWADVTLKQFVEINDVIQEPKDENNIFDKIERECRIYSILSGEHYKDLIAIPMRGLLPKLKGVDFINTLPDSEPVKEFFIGGYKWIVNHDVTSLKAENYMDITHLLKDPENVMGNLPALMAIFCSPQKEVIKKRWLARSKRTYQAIELSHKESVSIMWDCPVSVCYPLSVFFCNLLEGLMKVIPNFLNQKLESLKMGLEKEMDMLSIGVGM